MLIVTAIVCGFNLPSETASLNTTSAASKVPACALDVMLNSNARDVTLDNVKLPFDSSPIKRAFIVTVTPGASARKDTVPANPGVFAAKNGKPETAAVLSKPKSAPPLQNADALLLPGKCPAPQPTVAMPPLASRTNKCVSMATYSTPADA